MPSCFRLLFCGLICGLCLPVTAATLPQYFVETEIATGLVNATCMAFAPDGRLFVCQQGGALRLVKNGALQMTPVIALSVSSTGERGLLGVAFDPSFETNQFFYLYYTTSTSPIHNRVSRFVLTGDTAALSSQTILLDLNNLSTATNHNGGAIHFGPDGKLYIAVGENADGTNAQTLANLLGKVLRMNSDGTIPMDNPFYQTATDQNRLIWALGLRNPYTFSFQRGTGRLFINDVGQNTWEEINDGVAGANYGWPTYEGTGGSNAGFKDPLYTYNHNDPPPNGCAITGGAFYNPSAGSIFPYSYLGRYFFADYCGGWIYSIDPANPNPPVLFASGINSPVDLAERDGSLFYLARGVGKVLRVDYRPPTFAIWQQANFDPVQFPDLSVRDPGSDPDHDGIINLLEYWRGSSPFFADATPVSFATEVFSGNTSFGAISYQQVDGPTDLTVTVEACSALSGWQSGSGITAFVSQVNQGRTNLITIRDQTPIGGATRFLRVNVSKTP